MRMGGGFGHGDLLGGLGEVAAGAPAGLFAAEDSAVFPFFKCRLVPHASTMRQVLKNARYAVTSLDDFRYNVT